MRQENIKLFHSMFIGTLFVRCLFIAIRIIAWQSLTNSHYQVLEVEIVRLDLSVGQGVVKIEIENEV